MSLAGESFEEAGPAVSPDGRWLAYTSDQNGTIEVFVRPLSATAQGRWQVSNGGGWEPRWSHDGRSLFFVSPDGMVSARVETSPVFRVGGVERLFSTLGYLLSDRTHAMYAVTADGHFLMTHARTTADTGAVRPRLILIEHWLSEIGPLLDR